MTDRQLMDIAEQASKMAYVPYSRFAVGAALECSDGTVFTGCNVENAALGSTICAERTAACKAVSEGHTDFARIAIWARARTTACPAAPAASSFPSSPRTWRCSAPRPEAAMSATACASSCRTRSTIKKGVGK